MRVAIVSECFLPVVNGVTNSVRRIVEHLGDAGHDVLIVAPGDGPPEHAGVPVVRLPAVELPLVTSIPIGVPHRRMLTALRAFRPDVVHLAAPFVVGSAGLAAARRLERAHRRGLPDRRRRFRRLGRPRVDGPRRVALDLPPARALSPRRAGPSPSSGPAACRACTGGRAAWTPPAFTPRKRCPALRARLAPHGEVLVGYVGRLAAEKHVQRLAALAGLPGVRLVVVGSRAERGAPARAPARGRVPRLPRRRRTGAPLRVARRLRPHRTGRDVLPGRAGGAGLGRAGRRAGHRRSPRPGLPDRTGYLVGDDAALRTPVRRLLDPAVRARFGATARRSVLRRTWSTVGDELVAHYDAVLDEFPVNSDVGVATPVPGSTRRT